MTLQEQYNASGGQLTLRPGEYRGPLVISRPGSVIDGNGATIWADHGPVIRVRARGVRLENLRVEIMEDSADADERTAVHTLAPDTVLENVEVYGDVTGPIPGAGRCSIPRTSDLGTFASGAQNSFQLHVEVPSRTSVQSAICDVTVEPKTIGPGPADLTITAEELPNATSLYGDILFDGEVRRRTCLRGQAMADAPRRQARPRPMPRQEADPVQRQGGSSHSAAPASKGVSLERPQARKAGAEKNAVPVLQRGERRPLGALAHKPFRIALSGPESAKIDACVFALNAAGQVRSEDDFAVPGRQTTIGSSGAVMIGKDHGRPYAEIRLQDIDKDVDRLVVVFSDTAGHAPTRGLFQGAEFTVSSAGTLEYTFASPHMPTEQTVVAAEIYRHKGVWKLRCVDSGLNAGIQALYDMHGVRPR